VEHKLCDLCGRPCVPVGEHDGGCAHTTIDGKECIICYVCAGEQDRQYMMKHGRHDGLYLVPRNGVWFAENWPGSLRLRIFRKEDKEVRAGFIGMLHRTDVWFYFAGYVWHGVNRGDNNTLLRCRRTKTPDTRYHD